ncbi:UPF0161 protein yidD [Rhodothermus marinus SG0.5JP17-172]|uniref:membrane protein insertion efficiency factor YidD n=1 Tax=Rhodothermus marinus TaxID=29549 RepID=UPI000223DC9A|nr:membrane protein insertion efficiency factor YidD [Rhodothermus marinus]AEN73976.1 UPF0161 protein yidD [Rhodothermus marinus SG0.5JP17-172]
MQVLRAIGRFLWTLPRRLLIGLVRGYQLILGPHLPATCRYTPSCSNYAIEAFQKYGAVRGLILTLWRLARCHPWGGYGYDPPRWFGEPRPESSNPEHP